MKDKHGWIKVEDELPPDTETVMVWYASNVWLASYDKEWNQWNENTECWLMNPTHWQARPHPPCE